MGILKALSDFAQTAADRIADLGPAPGVDPQKLAGARLVAHRGFHGPGLRENSAAALGDCHRAGVWGVEFDVRWTLDQVPVLLHDPSTRRTYPGRDFQPGKLASKDILNRCPLPRLTEVVTALGGRCHLMIETKVRLTPEREAVLADILSPLEPARDYHLLTLKPEYLAPVSRLPRECFVFVGELNTARASEYVLKEGWGAVAGHYFLLTDAMINRHHAARQQVGVGFVSSPKNLCRQINRGVDWIFSNRAPALEAWRQARLDAGHAAGIEL
jgi:glycerophosphoryl diester phosphodiesterase